MTRLYSSEALVDERKAFTLVKRVRFPTEEPIYNNTEGYMELEASLISTQFKSFKAIEREKVSDPYLHSPFLQLKNLSSRKKGKYFEALVHEALVNLGHRVTKASHTDHDRVVDGKLKLEIKGSFLWGTGTMFRWQQIRTSQDYDVVCFAAFYPTRMVLYGATKQTVKDNLEVQDEHGHWIYNQHGGKKVNSGTFFIDCDPTKVSWLTPLEQLL